MNTTTPDTLALLDKYYDILCLALDTKDTIIVSRCLNVAHAISSKSLYEMFARLLVDDIYDENKALWFLKVIELHGYSFSELESYLQEGGLSELCALTNWYKTLRYLAQHIDVCVPYGDEQTTALHTASCEGHGKTVAVLVELGISVDAQDKAGYTPLFYAINANKMDTYKLLISLGATP